MTEINKRKILEEFTEFGKVKDVYQHISTRIGLHEFFTNVVMNADMFDKNNNNGHSIMLKDLPDIYVLISKNDFPFDKLTSTQKILIDLSKKNKNVVLGYIWLCPWELKHKGVVPCHFINFIDSRIRGLNISKYMIEKYETINEEQIYLLPFDITSSATEYWKKYFMEVYNVTNKKELNKMIINYKLEKHVKWSELYS